MSHKRPPLRTAYRKLLPLPVAWQLAFHRWNSSSRVRDAVQLTLATIGASCLVARNMSMLPLLARLALIVPPLLLLLWLVWRIRQQRPVVRSPLALPLLLVAASLATSSLLGVAQPDATLLILIQWGVAGLLLFMVIDLLALGWRPQLFLRAAALVSSAVLLSAAAALALWWLRWVLLWQPGEPLLPVGFRVGALGTHPNFAAMLVNIGLPMAVTALWGATRRAAQLLWAVWLLLATVVLFFTSSRGGWLAGWTAVAVTLVSLLWSAYRVRNWRYLRGALLLAGGYALLFALLFWGQRGEVLAQHGGSLLHPVGRLTFWYRALLLFGEHPLLGAGPAGYHASYLLAESSSRVFVAAHAHSLYLTVLSEQGLLGVAALLLLATSALMLWRRCWRAAAPALPGAGTHQPRLLLLAGLGALTSLFVHGLVDTPSPLISAFVLCIFAATLGVGNHWRLTEREDTVTPVANAPAPPHRVTLSPRHLVTRRATLLHMAAFLAALLAWGGYSITSRQVARWQALRASAGAALQRGQPRRAVDLYGQAIALRPTSGQAYSERAVALAALAGQDQQALRAALAAQDDALLRDPANRSAPLNRAMLLAQLGQPQQSEAELRAYVAADASGWGLPYLLLAHLSEQAGNATDNTKALWQRALDLQPELSESVACARSAVCPDLVPSSLAYSDTVAARRLVGTASLEGLHWIERQADRWESVDLWAVGALAAEQAGDQAATRRFLLAAQDQARLVGYAPTPQLGIALLQDALARRDRDDLRALLRHWTDPADTGLVPQITALAVTRTEQQLAQTALEAAAWLGETDSLSQAHSYARAVSGGGPRLEGMGAFRGVGDE